MDGYFRGDIIAIDGLQTYAVVLMIAVKNRTESLRAGAKIGLQLVEERQQDLGADQRAPDCRLLLFVVLLWLHQIAIQTRQAHLHGKKVLVDHVL